MINNRQQRFKIKSMVNEFSFLFLVERQARMNISIYIHTHTRTSLHIRRCAMT